jgi:hypothetical protein
MSQWVDRFGRNLTGREVLAILSRAAGVSHDLATLERTYRVGAMYRNGDLYFQRLS